MRRTLATLTVLLMAAPASSGPCITQLTDRCEAWSQVHDGPAGGGDIIEDAALSPDGTTLYVGGARTVGGGGDTDFAVLAYEAATGAYRWTAGYDGPGNADGASDEVILDLETDGERVYVTGPSRGGEADVDYSFATVAFDARTGQRLWVARYDGDPGAWDQAMEVELGSWVDPDGTRHDGVFVAGFGSSPGGAQTGIALGYDAATGAELWREVREGDWRTVAVTTATLPGGGTVARVHVSGGGMFTTTLDAATGEELWTRGVGDPEAFITWSSAAADGRVFVTGLIAHLDLNVGATTLEMVTAAHDAATGDVLWKRSHDDPNGDPLPEKLSTDGTRVYVTGSAPGDRPLAGTALTVAYDAATGAQRWVQEDEGLAGRGLSGWDVTSGGGMVFTAAYYPFTVIARDAVTGAERWTARITPPGAFDGAYALAVAPDGSRVFAGGAANGPAGLATGSDMLTAAWDL